ncbi:hypothetical protein [Methylobacterium variabile]|jgi:hypothetical protein|uniref:hypothetical protein n=1 Tax=Methylobacterium variabile TaxID=298794 RepID=UPI000ACD1D77|nr:hypothetical protein [Methylobacterium variabile]
MTDELKDQRIPIMMTPSEVKAVDDWMFENRIRSRGGAIRSLVSRGIMFDDAYEAIGASLDVIAAFQKKEITNDLINDYFKKVRKFFDAIKETTATNNSVSDQLDKIRSDLEIVVLSKPSDQDPKK